MPAAWKALPFGLLVACTSLSGATDFATQDPTTPEGTGGTSTRTPGNGGRLPDGGQAPADNGKGVAVVAPEGLDLGELGCGAASAPRTVEIRNHEKLEIKFETWLGKGGAFLVAPPNGTIAPGGTATLSVSAAIGPEGPVGKRDDVLSVTTNLPGDAPHELAVSLNVVGAIFKVAPGGELNYGIVHGTESKTITVSNVGNISGTLNVSASGEGFAVSPNGAVVVAGSASDTRAVKATPGTGGPLHKYGTLSFSSSSLLCGPLPPAQSLYARRFNND